MEFEPDYPQDYQLEAALVNDLTVACKAAGVELEYKVFWQ